MTSDDPPAAPSRRISSLVSMTAGSALRTSPAEWRAVPTAAPASPSRGARASRSSTSPSLPRA